MDETLLQDLVVATMDEEELLLNFGGRPSWSIAADESPRVEASERDNPRPARPAPGSRSATGDAPPPQRAPLRQSDGPAGAHSSPSSDSSDQDQGPPDDEIEIDEYQLEVAEQGLKGNNGIICLPTGTGKTRVAVYIIKKHLEKHGPRAKVMFLVNKVLLVEQHLDKELKRWLKGPYTVQGVSGSTGLSQPLSMIVKQNDITVCTAQLLYNALVLGTGDEDEEERLDITDFTLMVFDECHHTIKEAMYNKLMHCYLQKKRNPRGQKLPQIIGLTASLGTGKAITVKKAKEYILQLCANLDAWGIETAKINKTALAKRTTEPKKECEVADKRREDPFGDKIEEIMIQIQERCDIDLLDAFGTQKYEQKVVELQKRGVEEKKRNLKIGAAYLRKYNDALMISEAVRTIDAYNDLEMFHLQQSPKKDQDETDTFLARIFEEHKANLRAYAIDPRFENPKLERLEVALVRKFTENPNSRGIIFTRMRSNVHALTDWVNNNELLQAVQLKARAITGTSNQVGHMTQDEQRQVLRNFSNGNINLLISTTVAEEGLDITLCNFVIRHELVTTEIAMMQAKGRARAEDSTYVLLTGVNSSMLERERTNENRIELMKRAIDEIQEMKKGDYLTEIQRLQQEAMFHRQMEEAKKRTKQSENSPDSVRILCQNCDRLICRGSDIETIDDMHHVCTLKDFSALYNLGPKISFEKTFKDWKPGCKVTCADCNADWGFQIIYKGVGLANLKIQCLIMELEKTGERKTFNKWNKVPFLINKFNYIRYCEEHVGSAAYSNDDDDDDSD